MFDGFWEICAYFELDAHFRKVLRCLLCKHLLIEEAILFIFFQSSYRGFVTDWNLVLVMDNEFSPNLHQNSVEL